MKKTGMKTAVVMAATLFLAACASQDEKEEASTQDTGQAVRDFIELRELEELDALRSGTNDNWRQLDDTFIIYSGRRDTYLVEFSRRCHELTDNTRIVPDKRWDSNKVRARFETIRGCRIAKIYGLTEAEVAELENLGEAPGSRN
jgi:(p)ppGpp synthase/HD superfamily hydrolase